jgi:hypothetical protein
MARTLSGRSKDSGGETGAAGGYSGQFPVAGSPSATAAVSPYRDIRANMEQTSVCIGLDQYGRGCLGHNGRGCNHRRQRYRCLARRNMLGAVGVRRKRPTRFVILAGGARIDVPDHALGIPGLLGSSGAKLQRTARCSGCSWQTDSRLPSPPDGHRPGRSYGRCRWRAPAPELTASGARQRPSRHRERGDARCASRCPLQPPAASGLSQRNHPPCL